MIHFVRLVAVPFLAAMLFALSASAPRATSTAGPVYTTADLPVIVSPKPTSPKGVSWSRRDPYVGNSLTFTVKDWREYTNKRQAGQLSRAGFRLGANRVWDPDSQGDTYTTLGEAVVFAFLFHDARGGHAWYESLRGGPSQGKPLAARGLGSESFGEKLSGFAIYVWRSGNLVVAADVGCPQACDFNVAVPARAYANTINAQALRASH